MGLIIVILWLIRQSKAYLFWFYLWQLKEYQVKRFIDHFRTKKGEKLIFDKMNILKIIILACFLFISDPLIGFYLVLALFLIYFLETTKALADLFIGNLKIPVLTKKAILLAFLSFLVQILIIGVFVWQNVLRSFQSQCIFQSAIQKTGPFFWLLVFDLISPLIASLIVLALQPFSVLLRNKIINEAIKKREEFKNLIVIGITGSYGKTSTKEILYSILSYKFSVLKTKEHQNSEIAIAKTILSDLTEKHQIFIVEMGSYGKGGIKKLSEMVKPKIGIVAGINEQHLALFGSMDNLISAEGGIELAQRLPESGTLILNGNNSRIALIYKKPVFFAKHIFISTKEKADFWAEDIKVYRDYIYFKAFTGEEKEDFSVNLSGAHNVENVLLAIAVAKELGMSLKEISSACKNINLEQGGIKIYKKRDINVIDSSYSSNPDGVLADLDYLLLYSQKKVIVMPCLIELGPATSGIHRKIGKKIGKVCDLAIITTKDRFKEIKEGAMNSGMKEENIIFMEDPEKIIDKLSQFLNKEDAVLFEGRVPKKLIEMFGK